MNEETEKLYKILSQDRSYNNELFIHIVNLLLYIDKNNIRTQNGIKRQALVLISNGLDIPEGQINTIIKFVIEQNLIESVDDKIFLTSYGKLFIISDKVSGSVDIIKYIWEQMNWSEAVRCIENSKFLQPDGRRYIACLLAQLNNQHVSVENMKEKYSYTDFIYSSNSFVIRELLEDKYIDYILRNIFEPAGLTKVFDNNGKSAVSLTEAGKKVFEHYSYNMLDEYKDLVEESWECYDKGNFQEAFDTAVSVISVAGSMLEAYNIMGCVHIRKGEYDKAKDVFMYAIELCEEKMGDLNDNWGITMETYISMYYNLGLCYFYIGNYIKAMHTFTTIKKTLPYTLESLEMIMGTIRKLIVI
jgi:tetratricopeptide (TPR) repeat protein